MKDSFKTFPKIKVYSSDVAQWKKRIEAELREKITHVLQFRDPYVVAQIAIIKEILGDE